MMNNLAKILLLIFVVCFAKEQEEAQHESNGYWEIPLAEFESIVETGSGLVIDVREPFEVSEVRVDAKRFVNIPLGQVDAAFQMPADEFHSIYGVTMPSRKEEIVFICRSGKRSETSLNQARELEFPNSRHFQGGTLRWIEEHPDQLVRNDETKHKAEL